MTERIAVGDLVMVVRPSPCCGSDLAVGRRIFTVASLDFDSGTCSGCGANIPPVKAAFNENNGKHYQLNRLKRIPPLSELESSKTDEPIKEPA